MVTCSGSEKNGVSVTNLHEHNASQSLSTWRISIHSLRSTEVICVTVMDSATSEE